MRSRQIRTSQASNILSSPVVQSKQLLQQPKPSMLAEDKFSTVKSRLDSLDMYSQPRPGPIKSSFIAEACLNTDQGKQIQQNKYRSFADIHCSPS